MAFILTVIGLLSGLATYASFSSIPPFGNEPQTLRILLIVDLFILFLLFSITTIRIVSILIGRRKGLAGSKLHVRLIMIFGLLATVPAVIMTIFSVFFFHFGVQTWFSDRVSTAVNESLAVAEAYLHEHQQIIRADILAMANDLDRQAELFMNNQKAFNSIMKTQSSLRNFSEAVVFDGNGTILSTLDYARPVALSQISEDQKKLANNEKIAIMTGENEDRVRALVRLNNFDNAYLLVGRMVDQKVLSHLASTKEAVQNYSALQGQYSNLQITVSVIFVIVGLLLLVIAVWFGLVLARQLALPISAMMSVSERVTAGDFSARVREFDHVEEFDYLARSFNRMTSQLHSQRDELINANKQLDQRRRFTETILTGVTAGIVSLDRKGLITLANTSATDLLQTEADSIIGQKIGRFFPGIEKIIEEAYSTSNKITQTEITHYNKEKEPRTYLLRITIELIGESDYGAVLTFDDITELQNAQKNAAWADIARRIAHEIKNPLTPIQLSAERLKRKYLKQIEQDPEIFEQCTDTIVRHVDDIGRMVNEFSSFARMPQPKMSKERIHKLIKESVFLYTQSNNDIRFEMHMPDDIEPIVYCDPHQIGQVLTNLIQNAIDSVLLKKQEEKGLEGHIIVHSIPSADQKSLVISVQDNGLGLPEGKSAQNLTQPYVTHKEKGTGLGLAIVKKIIEDHKGELLFGENALSKYNIEMSKSDGACVSFLLQIAGIEKNTDKKKTNKSSSKQQKIAA